MAAAYAGLVKKAVTLPDMTERGARGRGERVEAARRQAALALGRDPEQRDAFLEPPKSSSPTSPTTSDTDSAAVTGRGRGVLSLGEAAARLDVSGPELEALITSGEIEALPTGYTRMSPTTEVERLLPAGT